MSLAFSKIFQDGCRPYSGRFGESADNWRHHAVRHWNAPFQVYIFDEPSGSERRGRRQREDLPVLRQRFSEHETDTAFEIRGELPGFGKKDVSIEFTDGRTIVVRGRVEQTSTSGKPPASALEGTETPATSEDEATVDREHQVTVQDEHEAEKAEREGTEVPEAKPADNESYSVKRSVREFSRTFTFSTDVNQEAVKANLKNGILTVEVPKVKKQENHRVNFD